MDTIDTQSIEEQAEKLYNSDKKTVDNFLSGKTKSLDYSALSRLVVSELTLNKNVAPYKILGFTKQQIRTMAQFPERYGNQIIKLMDYMYQKSGYMKRIIDYFSNMPKFCYYIDTEVLNQNFFNVKEEKLKNNYLKFSAQASKFNLNGVFHDIFKQLYLHDVCYAFVLENELSVSFYFLPPRVCQITGIVDGNVYKFAINRSLLTDTFYQTLPTELQEILESSKEVSLNNLVDIPLENSFCIKYHNNFLHLFPPLYPAINGIIAIDEYLDLAKTKAINDAYKLLVLKVPTKDGELTMGDPELRPFISVALQTVNRNIGVLPYPDDVESIEFSSTRDDDTDNVSNAISEMYSEIGVSESLMSGSSSGSELKLSITNDSGDIFRIFRMIENWVSLQMKLRGYIYRSYQFVYRIMDVTIFNQSEIIDEELKLAQASIPNKSRLCASAGISPSALIGNATMENTVFKDLFSMFTPLASSYTQSSDSSSSDDVGAPTKDDTEITEITEETRETDGNDPDNRI